MDTTKQHLDLQNSYQLFYDILQYKKLTALLQPIIDLEQQSIHGYESLIRGPSDSPYHSPVTLFDVAIRSGKLLELDLLCREKGISTFQEKHMPGHLFLNATPESLLEPDHRSGLTLEILQKKGIHPKDVVIEMTEQYPTDNFDVMRKAIEHYKSMGFKIAIDDLGAGYSSLRMWSELRPDYVKIDKHFIQGIHEDPVKQSFVRSINDIAQGLNCKVIAEGIETQDEYRAVFGMGITLGQGYYFSRPKLMPPYSVSKQLFSCPTAHACKSKTDRLSSNISTILNTVPEVSPNSTIAEIHTIFQSTNLTSIPVLEEDKKPLGLIRRSKILNILSTKFGRSLYEQKPIVDYIDDSTVIVDKEWSIEHVSKLVTDTMKVQIEDDFIITDNGCYIGIGKVIQLLKIITEHKVKNARHANPLTMLPGNIPIYEKIDSLLNTNSSFCIAYCDIDSFKPYNDVYGYDKGDKIIKKVADILLQHSSSSKDFVGHVGGDDFIVIFRSDDWKKRCNDILDNFKTVISEFYTIEDRENNGIWSKSRNGEDDFYPVMSISIGAVMPDPTTYNNYADIAELVTQAKRNAKNISGNSLFIERRTLSRNQNLL